MEERLRFIIKNNQLTPKIWIRGTGADLVTNHEFDKPLSTQARIIAMILRKD